MARAQRRPQQRQLGDEFGEQAGEAALGGAVGIGDGGGLAVGPDDEVDGAFGEMEPVAGEQGSVGRVGHSLCAV